MLRLAKRCFGVAKFILTIYVARGITEMISSANFEQIAELVKITIATMLS